ncbi:cysteine export CydDC family ABC transporter permease subunit/ATP-binding protein CydD [Desulfosporosinus orientis DSM 765]|uniref:Cysteine export CydDC family ABC transporter permease subunit/ATP-binding protein CydD n=1 Tax=Desulfosporosinus orientis (strain ATCC 19365 / DSM 765 / NCIMB 8382 / VKM B-1628 / Singapore I) TaxID=768706 RepID=G7WDB9_DESOD|nr:thiol reductant ABC exporter subunit CydD [Desulfosporosinus orientis]AET67604.1 cysteine export CydDC family ABC transporter permease subunit/ATP-binding protein CydD [Desulfosporosinus orientis DSM 765]
MFDKRLMRESKPVWKFLILSIALSIGIALLAVAQAWFFSRVAAMVFLEGAMLKDTWNSLGMILLIIGLRAVLQWASEISAFEAASLIKLNLRGELLKHIVSLGPIYARGERAGELITTVTEGIDSLEDYFAKYLPQLLLAAGIPLLILVFVFPRDWKSGLILLATGPLIPIFMILIGKLAEKKSLQQWQNLSWMSAHFLDVLKGLPTLKVFGRSKDQTRVIQKVSDSFRKSTLSVLRVAFLSALMLEFLATISTALVAVTIGLRLVNGTLTFSAGLFLLLLAPEFYTPLRTLGLNFHAGLSGKNAAERIFEILDYPLQTEPGLRTNPIIASNHSITFRNVNLVYQTGEPSALKDINFTLTPGEQIALVGPSGAGKTSVAQLLLGFINPASGEIEVNGADLKTMNLETWREQIAYVPQNPHLFAGTIADNIRFGRPAATLAEVKRAAEEASAHDFIMKLPDGYETYLGEEGAGLSGGQAQRIALARAFLKDAPILILDEATSNLDLESESLIQEALKRLLRGRTALIVAHRLDTVFQAQRILVLDQGQILEEGTHEDLLKGRGLYLRLLQQYRGETG